MLNPQREETGALSGVGRDGGDKTRGSGKRKDAWQSLGLPELSPAWLFVPHTEAHTTWHLAATSPAVPSLGTSENKRAPFCLSS